MLILLICSLAKAMASPGVDLVKEFARARPLKDYELQTLHYQRIGCQRQVFAKDGRSLEGDADLKAHLIEPHFLELEFASHYTVDSTEVESNGGRQLIDLHSWSAGQRLELTKIVTVHSSQPGSSSQTLPAHSEIRVLDGAYPSVFLIRETLGKGLDSRPELSVYFFCQ